MTPSKKQHTPEVQSADLLDLRPLEMHGFRLSGRAAVPVGKPTIEQWIQAMTFSSACYDACTYWVGDLMKYAESREDWNERMDQAIALTGLSKKTITNSHYVARHVDEEERQLSPSPSHTAEVAALPRTQQAKFLKRATEEGWTRNELRRAIRSTRRVPVIDGQAVLRGMFRVVYAAPDWDQPIETLRRMPVASFAAEDSVLFLWIRNSIALASPGPRDVIESWGFTYKSSFVWDRVRELDGAYTSNRHEWLAICTRGNCLPDAETLPDSVVVERGNQDGGKPESFRKLITTLYTTGPFLELFGARRVPGWTVLGADPSAWKDEVPHG